MAVPSRRVDRHSPMIDGAHHGGMARGFHPGRTVVLGALLIVVAMVGATFVWEGNLPRWLTAVLLVVALVMALVGWVMTFRDLSPPRRRP
jgi:UDP-N-acetylmuramyl pentapeptide phosphotransferase/UDP-N-acetylglucosamine-1-phosphate transferase